MRIGIFLFLPGRQVFFGKTEIVNRRSPALPDRPTQCNPSLATAWPFRHSRGPVAQWLEPAAHNGLVAGSSPAGPTNDFRGLRPHRTLRFFVNQSINQ